MGKITFKLDKTNLPVSALSLAGALIGGGLNMLFLESVSRGILRHPAGTTALVVTTIISGAIGYYLSKAIMLEPTYGRGAGVGALAGLLIGIMNGTVVFPLIGTVIGAGVGLALGFICGLIVTVIALTFGIGGERKAQTQAATEPAAAAKAHSAPPATRQLRLAGALLAIAFSPLPWLAFSRELNIDFNHPDIPGALALTPFVAGAAAWLLSPRIAAAASRRESMTPGAACCMLIGLINGLLVINPFYVIITAFLGLLSGLLYGPAIWTFARLSGKQSAAALVAIFLLSAGATGGAYKHLASISAAWKASPEERAASHTKKALPGKETATRISPEIIKEKMRLAEEVLAESKAARKKLMAEIEENPSGNGEEYFKRLKNLINDYIAKIHAVDLPSPETAGENERYKKWLQEFEEREKRLNDWTFSRFEELRKEYGPGLDAKSVDRQLRIPAGTAGNS
jgi:hypothetical protein